LHLIKNSFSETDPSLETNIDKGLSQGLIRVELNGKSSQGKGREADKFTQHEINEAKEYKISSNGCVTGGQYYVTFDKNLGRRTRPHDEIQVTEACSDTTHFEALCHTNATCTCLCSGISGSHAEDVGKKEGKQSKPQETYAE
jgi:hypothetical protein